ncbi:hypothetical protein E2C01_044213 [Portunus trituberculatus]|uniref:Uncharacterized protein n=1 Tax=Portunus trituberculatus TaxID=210409 RepID=A0A5B7FYG6_PORTR|nr:hypothetical protein [Portunus trituberculatus]
MALPPPVHTSRPGSSPFVALCEQLRHIRPRQWLPHNLLREIYVKTSCINLRSRAQYNTSLTYVPHHTPPLSSGAALEAVRRGSGDRGEVLQVVPLGHPQFYSSPTPPDEHDDVLPPPSQL